MRKEQQSLLQWYSEHQRDFPWRKTRDPYRIWISEVMLQQTTVTAVIPYFEKFLARFPNVEALAQANESQVLQSWAGLGYYSRAKMLHKSAKAIAKTGFPKSHDELLKLFGFGPYTARAVASLAFGETVGVVDGNVVRVLSRLRGTSVEWWKPKGREVLQNIADEMVQNSDSSQINQAFMDLGSMVCTPKNPKCLLCPWIKSCKALAEGKVESYPLTKPRRSREIWVWQPQLIRKGNKILYIKNDYAPFLKGQWLPPGSAAIKKSVPKKYLFRHSITHHDIFVVPANKLAYRKGRYLTQKKIEEINPTSLVKKLLELSR